MVRPKGKEKEAAKEEKKDKEENKEVLRRIR